jgi:hypothetical protein
MRAWLVLMTTGLCACGQWGDTETTELCCRYPSDGPQYSDSAVSCRWFDSLVAVSMCEVMLYGITERKISFCRYPATRAMLCLLAVAM